MNFVKEIQNAREKANTPISQLSQSITPKLQSYTDTLNKRYARFFNVVELITPINAAAEKAKFLASDISQAKDPVFFYDHAKLAAAVSAAREVDRMLEEVSKYNPCNRHERFYQELLMHRLQDAILTGSIAHNVAESKDSAASAKLIEKFGLPAKNWVNQAWAEYDKLKTETPADYTCAPHILGFLSPEERDFLQNTTYKAPEISEAFRRVAAFYGFKMGWQFPIDKSATACDVRSASFSYDSPAMVVPETRECSGMKLLELIGHEIEEHMRQEENGSILFSGLGHAMMKGDETHLEGIAKISDITFSALWEGKVSSSPSPWYILAIEHARAGNGFANTARSIYDLVRDTGKTEKQAMATAWNTTLRVKRGNTQNHPSFVQPKDAGYLIGYHLAREVESAGLGQYLEMGCFSTEWIIRIAEHYLVEPNDIPFPRRDAARRYFEHEMSAHKW